ncbi:MAG: hypothetical protein GY810_00755 [Aureispira sp.]|nr:hypothetical protein [Aureispira sp.]
MKKLIILLLLIVGTISVDAQVPQSFQYQAVARANTGLPLANQAVSIRLSVVQGTPTGIIIYSETHSPTTNQYGLFTLDVGAGTVVNGAFNTVAWGSNNYFLKVEMDESGGVAYQTMGTTQLLAVPYALHAETVTNADDADANPTNELQNLSIAGSQLTISNGNTITLPSGGGNQTLTKSGSDITLSNSGGTVTLNDDDATNELQNLSINNNQLSIGSGNTVTLPSGGGTLEDAYNHGGAGLGASIAADNGEVSIIASTTNSTALRADNTSTGVGLISNTTNASNTFSAIQANTNSSSAAASAIIGNSTGVAWPVAGQVDGAATAEAAVYGSNLRTNGGHGVYGVGFNGVVGQTGQSTGMAMFGDNLDAVTPLGNGIGVAGKGYWGVVGEDRYTGGTAGAYGVYSNGNMGATGTKTFQIDHPKDPENKYLRHFSIESDEVLNVYRGTIAFDQNGEAVVTLPDYFSDINRNVSYQLTPVGAYMPLFVKEKVKENTFVVGGGQAGKEVSWAVYAERNDLYMQKNPHQRAVEIEKREGAKGTYLMPSLYDQPASKGTLYKGKENIKQQPLNVLKK